MSTLHRRRALPLFLRRWLPVLDLATRNIDNEFSGLVKVAGTLGMLVGHDSSMGRAACFFQSGFVRLNQTDPLPPIALALFRLLFDY